MKFSHLFFFLLLCSKALFSETTVDFSSYRVGGNNRSLFEGIIRDLNAEFGDSVTTAYGNYTQAKTHQIVIDEAQMDKFLKETEAPTEREAIARFILAHEYFHVILKHPYAQDEIRTPDEIEITGTYSEARKKMEQQVDHLAAKYLYKLGLPTEPIHRMFSIHPELHGGGYYPTAGERSEIVLQARNSGIDQSHFDNKAIRCTFLLGKLAQKLH